LIKTWQVVLFSRLAHWFRAAKKALSFRLFKSLRPARKISLFLALCFKPRAFCFKPAMAWYSSLGNVKLSRMNLGFLSFVSAAAVQWVQL
jgi:hypothetical protein